MNTGVLSVCDVFPLGNTIPKGNTGRCAPKGFSRGRAFPARRECFLGCGHKGIAEREVINPALLPWKEGRMPSLIASLGKGSPAEGCTPQGIYCLGCGNPSSATRGRGPPGDAPTSRSSVLAWADSTWADKEKSGGFRMDRLSQVSWPVSRIA